MTESRAEKAFPPAAESDALIQAFRQGDRDAFDRVYDASHRPLLSFCIRLTGSREAGEDLLQETFLAAFRSVAAFRTGAKILPWLLGIAVRQARDRRRKRLVPTAPHFEETDLAPLPEEDVAGRLAYEAALQTLSEKHREAFLLVVGGQLTHAEAATVLNCPTGTVKWRVSEAARRLRLALTEESIP